MKKLNLAAAMITFAFAFSAAAFADGLEEYYDYPNEDGTFSYYFDAGVTVTVDEDFYRATHVEASEDQAVFYHTASQEKFAGEGLTGGRLFALCCSEDEDFEELPSYAFIGYDGEEELNYFVQFPTDYQAYVNDAETEAEFQALYAKVEEIAAGIELDANEDVTRSFMLGGWTMTEDTALTEDVQEAFQLATKGLLGASYEPVALLATQVVSGTNYCILCKETLVIPDAQPFYTLMYIYRDLQGNAQLLGFSDIVVGDYE